MSGEDLVEEVPEIAKVAEVSATSLRQVPGSELNLEDLIELAGEIQPTSMPGRGASSSPRAPIPWRGRPLFWISWCTPTRRSS